MLQPLEAAALLAPLDDGGDDVDAPARRPSSFVVNLELGAGAGAGAVSAGTGAVATRLDGGLEQVQKSAVLALVCRRDQLDAAKVTRLLPSVTTTNISAIARTHNI